VKKEYVEINIQSLTMVFVSRTTLLHKYINKHILCMMLAIYLILV